MASETFKVGDVVVLNSSDWPKMTVTRVGEGTYLCTWYAKDAEQFKHIEVPTAAVSKSSSRTRVTTS